MKLLKELCGKNKYFTNYTLQTHCAKQNYVFLPSFL